MFKCTHTPVRLVAGAIPQRGSALIIALVFLLIMTLLGVSAMQGTTQQESMAGNARQRNLAFQAAEAAVRSGEQSLEVDGPTAVTLPASFIPPATDPGTFWMDYDWTQSRPYNGTLDPTLSAPPRYVIEPPISMTIVDDTSAALGPIQTVPVTLYRVTARGVGATADADGTPNAVVILQTVYRPTI